MAQRIRVGTIRTTSRTFGPEEIRRLKSTAEDSPDWEEDVDRVLEQLGTVGVDDGVGIGALRRWATHPDERIQVALLSSGLTETRTWEEHEPEILGLIAYREAQGRTRGEIWTPTTDALASLIQWKLSDWTSPDGFGKEGRSRDHWASARWRRRNAVIVDEIRKRFEEQVAPKIRAKGLSTGQAKRILAFTKFDELANVAIEAVRSADPAFVRWLARKQPRYLAKLANRSDLGPEVEAEIWRCVVRSCEKGGSDVPVVAIVRSLRERNALPPNALGELLAIAESPATRRLSPGLVEALMMLAWDEETRTLEPEEVVARIAPRLPREQNLLAMILHFSAEAKEGRLGVDRLRAIARGLVKAEPVLLRWLSAGQLRELQPEDWLPALRAMDGAGTVADALLDIPSATSHPEGRRFILERGDRSTVLQFLEQQGLRPGEERAAALALLRVAKRDLFTRFERWPQVKKGLRPKDLGPLLASEEAEVRQAAILLAGEIGRDGAPLEGMEPDGNLTRSARRTA